MKKQNIQILVGSSCLRTPLLGISLCMALASCNNRNDKDISINEPVDAVGAAMNPDPGNHTKDSELVIKAYSAGAEEAELADQVKGQLSNKELRKLAEMMSNEHRRINNELKAVAEKKDIPLPLGAIKDESAEFLARNTQNGLSFDKAYVDKLVEDHSKALELFTTLSKQAKDKDIRTFFEQHLDLINHHLYMANAIRDSVLTNQNRQK